MTDLQQQNHYLQQRLAAAEQRIASLTREQSVAERDEISATMTRWDTVAALFGETASRPVPGESAVQYRRRQLENFKRHSPRFRAADLSRLDSSAIAPVESEIVRDAEHAAFSGVGLPPGKLVARTVRENGRDVIKFTGDPMGWMSEFMLEGVPCAWPGGR